jgi:hypothetical protein
MNRYEDRTESKGKCCGSVEHLYDGKLYRKGETGKQGAIHLSAEGGIAVHARIGRAFCIYR